MGFTDWSQNVTKCLAGTFILKYIHTWAQWLQVLVCSGNGGKKGKYFYLSIDKKKKSTIFMVVADSDYINNYIFKNKINFNALKLVIQ